MPTRSASASPWMDGAGWWMPEPASTFQKIQPTGTRSAEPAPTTHCAWMDVDQAVADEPFSWTNIPTAQAEKWIAGKSFTYFVGQSQWICAAGGPGLHRRHVLKIAGDLCLVRDVALGRAEHELEIRWHFAPDLEVRNEVRSEVRDEVRNIAAGRLEISRVGAESDESGLTLIVPEDTVWQTGDGSHENTAVPRVWCVAAGAASAM